MGIQTFVRSTIRPATILWLFSSSWGSQQKSLSGGQNGKRGKAGCDDPGSLLTVPHFCGGHITLSKPGLCSAGLPHSWDSAWAPHCCPLLFHQCRGDISSPLWSAPTCLTTLGRALNHPLNSVNSPPIKSSSVPPLGMASAACQARGWWIEETSSMARSFPTSHLAKSME